MVKFEANTNKFGLVTAVISGPSVGAEACALIESTVNHSPTPQIKQLVNTAACFVTVTQDPVAGYTVSLELWGRSPQPLLNYLNDQLALLDHELNPA